MTDRPSLAPPDEDIDDWCGMFDLAGVLQFTLIHALEQSAAANGFRMKQDAEDGWYSYRGSIDTSFIAEALAYAAKRKERSLQFDAVEKRDVLHGAEQLRRIAVHLDNLAGVVRDTEGTPI